MKIRVLGAAAGGGFPQWNCNCENCTGVRDETLNAQPRTQSSIAVTTNGHDWLLVNASPDIRQQILATPALQPRRSKRDTGIRAVLLVDSQIDHVTGLLMLREHQAPLQLYCTDRVHEDLTTGLPIVTLLSHYCGVERHRVPVDGQAFSVPGLEPLVFAAIPLSSKAPPYSPHRDDPRPGDNIGLQIEDPQRGYRVFYAPGLGVIEPHLEAYMAAADLLLIDGTCWTDDEMARRGVGTKRARAMGHLPQAGSDGMLAALSHYPDARKVLIHINNTNPILVEDGAERAQLDAAGIEVAYDGMELQP